MGRIPRKELAKPHQKKSGAADKIAYISTYDRHAQIVCKAIMGAWHLLQIDPKDGRLFTDPPKFVYLKGRTIGNQLIRSDIRKKKKSLMTSTVKKGTYPCAGCSNCGSVIKGESIAHPNQGYKIPAKGYYTCNSDYVVYMLKCPCGKAYIGQKSRPIKNHLNEHKSSIRLYQSRLEEQSEKGVKKSKYGETEVAKHFHENRHQVSELKWLVIKQLYGDYRNNPHTKLLQREAYWICIPCHQRG